MSTRRYDQFMLSLEKKVCNLYLKLSFGASGAPTIVHGKNIAAVTRLSAGKFQIFFGVPQSATDVQKLDPFYSLLAFQHSYLDTAAPAAPSCYVVTDNSPAASIIVQFNSAGTATDPASGETALMHITLSNSGV